MPDYVSTTHCVDEPSAGISRPLGPGIAEFDSCLKKEYPTQIDVAVAPAALLRVLLPHKKFLIGGWGGCSHAIIAAISGRISSTLPVLNTHHNFAQLPDLDSHLTHI